MQGIGKTLLWRDALARARVLGYAVLTTRCSEEEMSGALVGLADLFEDVAVDRLRSPPQPIRSSAGASSSMRSGG